MCLWALALSLLREKTCLPSHGSMRAGFHAHFIRANKLSRAVPTRSCANVMQHQRMNSDSFEACGKYVDHFRSAFCVSNSLCYDRRAEKNVIMRGDRLGNMSLLGSPAKHSARGSLGAVGGKRRLRLPPRVWVKCNRAPSSELRSSLTL